HVSSLKEWGPGVPLNGHLHNLFYTLEKHVPVIEKTADGYKVTIGSVAHPMQEEHYIEWIELLADGKAYTQFLKPGDAPTATFQIKASKVTAREFCNLHGHWSAQG
ncbi:MAG: desulfoferrodoxin family protein, partial [Desulfuromonadales bacterium]|nr:desulfoferrodoxin family protein [Desulfuromonadales bacterium]